MFKFFKQNKKDPENLEQVISYLKSLEKNIQEVSRELEVLKDRSHFFIQKVGMIRYNPFKSIGGDQSFSIALLDQNNSGFIITSLYTQEGNRVYSKPVIKGKSSYKLSSEEEEAIKKAND